MKAIEERNELLKDLLNELRELMNYHRGQENKARAIWSKIDEEFKTNSEKLTTEYRNFLYILEELMYLANSKDNIEYRTKMSKGDIVSDLNLSYKYIDVDKVMSASKFLEMCQRHGVVEGGKKDYYKPVNYDGKTIRSYVFNAVKINELLREMNM